MPRESLSPLLVGGWAPTVDLQVHFLRPGQPGDTILAVGRIISAGQTLVHAEASLASKATGKKLAVCTATFLNMAARTSGAVMRDA